MILVSRAAGPLCAALVDRIGAAGPGVRCLAVAGDASPTHAGPQDPATLRIVEPARRSSWLRAMHQVDHLLLVGLGLPDEALEEHLLDAATAAGVSRILRVSPALGGARGHGMMVRHAALDERVLDAGGIVLRLPSSYQDLLTLTVQQPDRPVFVHAMAEGRLPFIDPRDALGAVCVALLRPGVPRDRYDVTGPESLDATDVVRMVSHHTGAALRPHGTSEAGLRLWLQERRVDHHLAAAVAAGMGAARDSSLPRTDGFETLTGVEPRDLTAFLQQDAVRLHAGSVATGRQALPRAPLDPCRL